MRLLDHAMLEHAALRPDAIAFTDRSHAGTCAGDVTYAALSAEVAAFAEDRLADVPRGSRALLVFPPGIDFVVALLACLRAGLIAVPVSAPRVDQQSPVSLRLAGIAKDADPAMIMTSHGLQSAIRPICPDRPTIAWDGGDKLGAKPVARRRDPLAGKDPQPVKADQPALIQYSSGSTGSPKGVVLTHGNIAASMRMLARNFEQDAGSVFVTWLPHFHDMGLFGTILLPVYLGGRSILMSPQSFLRNPASWLQAISRHRATTSGAPNFAFEHCVRHVDDEALGGVDLSCWRVAFNGAEPVAARVLRAFSARFAKFGFAASSFVPAYGLAEATLLVASRKPSSALVIRGFDPELLAVRGIAADAAADCALPRELVGCGVPPDGLEINIVDPDKAESLGADHVGEIWVRGASVGVSYWNQPALTEEVFRARAQDGSGVWMRTGDLGFRTADGTLFVTGRRKDLLIIHGRNIHPQDVEDCALRNREDLAGAAAFQDAQGRCVLLVEPRRGPAKGALADTAAIQRIVDRIRQDVRADIDLTLDEICIVAPGGLEKTTSGKLRRASLRARHAGGELRLLKTASAARAEVSCPRDRVTAILARCLRVPRGALDASRSPLQYGLDSLTAMLLSERLQTEMGVICPADRLLSAVSIAALIDACLDANATSGRDDASTAPRDARLGPTEASFWAYQTMSPRAATHNLAVAVVLPNALTASLLSARLDELQRVQPRLAARIALTDGVPGWSAGSEQLHLERLDMQRSGADATSLCDALHAQAMRPFDLARGPLLRALLVAAPSGGNVLLLVAHHVAADLQSMSVVLHHLLCGVAPGSAPATITGTAPARPGRFGLSCPIDGGAPLALAMLTPRACANQRLARRQRFTLSAATASALGEFGRQAKVTPAAILLAAYAIFLARHAPSGALRIGLPLSCRGTGEAHEVGCFIAAATLEIDVQAAATARMVIADCAARLLASMQLADRLKSDKAAIDGAETAAPIPQTLFAFQQLTGPAASLAPLLGLADPLAGQDSAPIGTALPLDRLEIDYPLSLVMTEHQGSYAGALDYQENCFSPDIVAEFIDRLRHLIDGMLASPDSDVFCLGLNNGSLVQTDTVATATASPVGTIWTAIAAQAERTPDNCAVAFGNASLTYRNLLSAACIAAQGSAMPRGEGSRVALIMPPGIALVASMLAAWQAGACIVPLDPALPDGRLLAVLDQAKPALVIAEASVAARLGGKTPYPIQVGVPAAAEPAAGLGPGLPVPTHQDALAWIIFTSGSSGEPKGVMVSHRAALTFARGQHGRLGLSPSSRVLQLASPGFDASLSDLLMALPFGHTLVIAPPAARLPGPELQALIGTARIGLITASASLLCATAPLDWPDLQAVISVAEPCQAAFIAAWGRYRLYNGYGPTEAAIGAALGRIEDGDGSLPFVPVGTPFDFYAIRLLDPSGRSVPPGAVGEICIGGPALARGYLDDPRLTALAFVPDPLAGEPGARMYRSGDLGRRRWDGRLECLGRLDQQVKLRGVRIEPREVERAIETAFAGGRAVVRKLSGDAARGPAEDCLVAYIAGAPDGAPAPEAVLRQLRERLPAHMVPRFLLPVDTLPMTLSGKLDQAALPAPPASPEPRPGAPAAGLLARVAAAVGRVLQLDEPDPDTAFFDLGGTSLMLPHLLAELAPLAARPLGLTDLLAHPTIRGLADHIDGLVPPSAEQRQPARPEPVAASGSRGIAIVGYALRAPGASTPDAFWAMLCSGGVGTRRFNEEELAQAGVPASQAASTRFVPVRGVVEGIEDFDATLFGLSATDAAILDPQNRLLLECAHDAIEVSGHRDAEAEGRSVGVFVGAGRSFYAERALLARPDLALALGAMRIATATDRSFAATGIAYRLDLSGPCLTIDTACSSSLVAVHQACRSLRDGECDLALAGGVSVEVPQIGGHLHEPGHIGSGSGFCRPFGAAADGALRGMGCAMVVLRRLDDAVADGDTIRAVILGSAVNNDGACKVGFTAPSQAGQTRVIRAALRDAGVQPADIAAIEAHGTGTELGDRVELAALSEVFAGAQAGSMVLGTAKAHVGHLDTAAGAAGLIKAVLSLEHGAWPPMPHAAAPHPALDGTPFRLAADLETVPPRPGRHRMGVSSFGIGGTNAHVVLQAAPAPSLPHAAAPATEPRRPVLIRVSAASPASLVANCAALERHLATNPGLLLEDVAFSLARRPALPLRFATSVRSIDALRCQLADRLDTLAGAVPPDGPAHARARHSVAGAVFLYPGQGSLRAGNGAALYNENPAFRAGVDRVAAVAAKLGQDLTPAFAPDAASSQSAQLLVARTESAQLLILAIEIGLTEALAAAGLVPALVIGHSIGAFAAAVAAGVASLDEVVTLVAARGRLMQACPPGAMLACASPAERVVAMLHPACDVAALNGPEDVVLAGPVPAIGEQERMLRAAGIACDRVQVDRAFHSRAMTDALAPFAAAAGAVTWRSPAIPMVSDSTGNLFSAAPSAEYWVGHLRNTIQFGAALRSALQMPGVFIEVGPGRQLSALLRRQAPGRIATATLPPAEPDEAASLVACCARAWVAGCDLVARTSAAEGRRIPLPTYGFDRQRHWFEPLGEAALPMPAASTSPQDEAQSPGFNTAPMEQAESVPTPQTLLEAIWTQLLGTAPGPGDNFFACGGDSLLAVRLCSQLGDALGLSLHPRLVLENPDFGDLQASLLAHAPAAAGATKQDDVPVPSLACEAPLIPGQLGIWTQHLLEGEIGQHNLAACLALHGKLDLAALESAVTRLGDHHKRLLGRIEDRADGAVLTWADAGRLRLEVVSCSAADLDAAVEVEGNRRFDLRAGPLARARLFRVAEDDHALVLTLHHIVGDGASLVLLYRDLVRFYGGADRTETALAAAYAGPPVHTEADLAFWREAISGAEQPILPWAGGNAAPAASRGADYRVVPSQVLAAAVRDCARAQRTTPFVVILSALKLLLFRATGQEDLTICTPASLLSHSRIEAIGLHVTMLPLRTSLDAGDRVETLIGRVGDGVRQATAHAHVPFELILQAARLPADALCVAIGQQHRAMPGELPGFPGLRVETRLVSHSVSKFALTLWIEEGEAGLGLGFEYREACFTRAQIACLADSLQALLLALPREAQQRLDTVSLCGPQARRALHAWNATSRVWADPRMVPEAIADRATRAPDRIALIEAAGGATRTYGALLERSDLLARGLAGRGVRPGDRIGLCLPRGIGMVEALLAILRAGAAFVPLDAALPPARLGRMVETAALSLVIGEPPGGLLTDVGGRAIDWVMPEALAEAGLRSSVLLPRVQPSLLAYVLFTSGSTGEPKGAMNGHAALFNRLAWMIDAYAIGPGDIVLQKTRLGFDVAIWELLVPLMVGATMVLAAPGSEADPAALAAAMRRRRVTIVHFVPSMLDVFLASEGAAGLGSLRLLVSSGEALDRHLADAVCQAAPPGMVLANLYGPTEAAIDVTAWDCQGEIAGHAAPIGVPIANTTIQVLDPAFNPLPPGMIGEICIGGVAVGQGYIGRPDLTAAQFRPDPAGGPGARLYATGDLGRWLADGRVEFLGRADDQVKLRGQRIELAEIAATLRGTGLVQSVASLVLDPGTPQASIATAVVPHAATAAPVLHWLQRRQTARLAADRLWTSPDGTELMHINAGETRHLWREIFQAHGYDTPGLSLAEGDIVVDVGANIGLFALWASRQAPGLSVFAYEIIPDIAVVLRENLAAYVPGARCFALGLGAQAGTERTRFYPRNTLLSGGRADDAGRRSVVARLIAEEAPDIARDPRRKAELVDHALAAEERDVQVGTLGEQIAQLRLPRIDLLKIDVEGAEDAVLTGLGEAGWPIVRQILVETSAADGSAASVEAMLRARGFEVRRSETAMSPDGALCLLHACRPDGHALARPAGLHRSPCGADHAQAVNAQDLVRRLRRSLAALPEILHPAQLVVLPSLPVLASGKLDRHALKRSLPAGAAAQAGPAQAANPVQATEAGTGHAREKASWRAVRAAFAAALPSGVDIAEDTHFFRSGGNSLSAARAASVLEQTLGQRIGLRLLFEYPEAGLLAVRIDAQIEALASLATQPDEAKLPDADWLPPPDADPGEAFPLTNMQRAYWLGRGAALPLGNVATHGYVEIDVPGLDLARLRRAVDLLVRLHPMLRAIVTADGQQRILPNVPPVELPAEDLRGAAVPDREARLAAIRTAMSHRVFDLEAWPLFDLRASLLPGDTVRLHLGIDAFAVDGWSLRLLERDLGTFYVDPDALVPAPSHGFADYMRAAAAAAGGPRAVADRVYWLDRVAALPPAPPLPYARPLDSIAQPVFVRRAFRLAGPALARLRAQAAGHGTTLSITLLACYADLLSLWSGSRHFVVCVTSANRRQLIPDVEAIVGNFTDLILVEADLRGAACFADAASALGSRLSSDLDHRGFDGVEVRRALAHARGGLAETIIPVVFTSMVDVAVASPAADAPPAGPFDLRRASFAVSQTSQVALDCTAVMQVDGLAIFLDAVEAALPADLLDDLAEAFEAALHRLGEATAWSQHLLDGAVAAQMARRTPLSLPPHAVPWHPEARLLHGPVLWAMRAFAGRTALDWAGGTMSYAALEAHVRHLAGKLAGLGTQPGELVAIAMERGPEQIVASLAILVAGCAYVPIDANLPPRRRADMLRIAEARIVLTQPHLLAELAADIAAEVIAVDLEAMPDRPDSAPWPCAVVDPHSLAYVLFTSGSTGTPKGVMIEHDAALNTVRDVTMRLGTGPDDAVLGVSALGFDLSVFDIFGVLGAGGRLVMPEASALPDPAGWLVRMREGGVTLWNSVPALAKLLLDAAGPRDAALEDLRAVLLSGDWIPIDLAPQLRAHRPGLQILGLGGATEASIWSIAHDIGEVQPGWTSIPYGRALTGQTVSVRDTALRHCPDHVVGEICIGGVGVARGYWRDPLRTAERFVADPHGGGRLYLTGDLGRTAPNGEIVLIGRSDHQVKLNGHRLELGEIEHAIERHALVDRAVVVLDEAPGGTKRLVAHVLPASVAERLGAAEGDVIDVVTRAPEDAVAWSAALQAGWRAAAQSHARLRVSSDDMADRIGALTATYLASAENSLAELGVFASDGECRSAADIVAAGQIEPRYARWLARALGALAQAGMLLAEPGRPGFFRCPRRLRIHAALPPADCGARPEPWLTNVLRGRELAAERYIADSMMQAYRDTFQHSHMVAAAVADRLLEGGEAARPRDLLEVGAGYGSLTEHVLPLLGAGDRYVFTDVSSFFLTRGKEHFQHPGISFELLDLNHAPDQQGFADRRFDIIIAASVLHACFDVEQTLLRLRSLMRPAGILLMIEETQFYPFFDLGMGLQSGFDTFTDTKLRREHPLLSRAEWQAVLKRTGFTEAAVLASDDAALDRMGFDVIVAQGPDRVPRLNEDAMRDYLRTVLPVHAIPRDYRLLATLPITPTGKVDRLALQGSTNRTEAAPRRADPPSTPVECDLAPLWERVLPGPKPGRGDDFFAMGGDSLLAARLTLLIREQFEIDLPVRTIFEAPVFADLATLIGLAANSPPLDEPVAGGLPGYPGLDRMAVSGEL